MDNEELSNIVISVLALALAFTIAYGRGSFGTPAFAQLFFVVLITVGSGFILHEMAHKFVAQRYGARAAYQAWPLGLLLAITTSIFGFIFAAPGAVYIYAPYLRKKENGIISLAGPLTNLLLAFLFLAATPFMLIALPRALAIQIASLGVGVNVWLGFFNMLPIPPLDGSKVFYWNKGVWAAFALLFFLLTFVF